MKRVALLGFLLIGCRGDISHKPPIHIPHDQMQTQQKFHPQGESKLFADGRAMRMPVDGTVPQGALKEDDGYFRGKNADGTFLARAPITVTETTIKRGQERFNIYCAPCHDRTGAGRGMVVQRGFFLPVNLASEHTRQIGDGEIFDYISNGVRNMPSYGAQVPEEDRWAIVTWVRVLQRSQYASLNDVPAEMRDKIEREAAK